MSERMMSVTQAASELGYSTRTIRNMIDRGKVKAVKPFGGHWRVFSESVSALKGEKPPRKSKRGDEWRADRAMAILGVKRHREADDPEPEHMSEPFEGPSARAERQRLQSKSETAHTAQTCVEVDKG